MSAKVQGGRGARTGRRLAAATGAVLALLLAGCTSIPGAGSVQTGLKDLERVEQASIRYNADGPVAGASQEDIARAFVVAAISPTDDYAVAREFLVPEYAAQWDPSYGVLVDDGSRSYTADGAAAGVMSLSATAKVDADGVLLPVGPGPETELRFEFERVGGEWRISSAPAGIILDSTKFQEIWTPQQLYFVGAGNVLVPETRWYLARSSLATEIVGALLDGPGERMQETVHSGFPAGTALVSSSVPIVDGRARIDLTAELLEAGAPAMAEVRQQLATSLQSVAGVTGFELLVEGTEVRDTPDGASSAPATVSEVSNPAVLTDGRFGTLVSGEFTELPGYAETIAEYEPRAITLALDESAAAVLGPEGATLLDDENSVLIDPRRELLAPAFDRLGFVWTVQATAPQTLQLTARDGTVTSVPAPWLAGRTPVAVRVSPDGARIAALVTSDADSQVLVAAVVRDDEGRPTGTSAEADTVLWAEGSPVDLDWTGQRGVVVLTAEGSTVRVSSCALGQFPSELGAVQGGARVTGGGARSQIRVLGADGALFAAQNSGWQRVDGGIEVLAKRG
ncbi:LpqB family beta-propeller domain-containing protein [Leucobacter allii]|uniref:LpqB family beta-propeller domain-containing protein n=1 Tax=Leucobacter allii TaxID=2932247 RepID=UPI001FD607A2|nr:LpqB family beta-propeller domain-containing protein [Leucobacter allii]UOR00888.1 LpqB family beta-propeller domain-containing protein [Leucobacter allii]